MKLIDLLVQELPKLGGWPIKSFQCAQDDNCKVCFYTEGLIHRERTPSTWSIPRGSEAEHQGHYSFYHDSMAVDADTAIVTHEQYKVALAASQQTVWNGEGLPPVGITCEHCPGGATQHEWEIVTVIGISERPGGSFTDYWLRKEDGSSYVIGNPYRFRPICTEAERKREEGIDGIVDFCVNYYAYPKGAEQYLKIATTLYDAIAAGKIPGVKLDD